MIRGPRSSAGMTNVKVTVNRAEVSRVLDRLPARLSEGVRKRAIRSGTRPYVKKLAQVWRAANYDGSGIHRRAIAASVKLDGPRRRGAGPAAPLMFEIGVDYGAKRGKYRQRIWHLLEAGFRHKASGRRIPGRFMSLRWARMSAKPMFEAVADAILVEARKALR